MSVMSSVEATFCRSAPWRGFTRRVVLPWALRHAHVGPQVLEIGGGSGAMAYELLTREPDVRLTLADMGPSHGGGGQSTPWPVPWASQHNPSRCDSARLS